MDTEYKSIKVDEDTHTRLKVLSAELRLSMKDLIAELVYAKVVESSIEGRK